MRAFVMPGMLSFVVIAAAAFAAPATGPVCGTGANAFICFASIDQPGKVKPELRERLAAAGTRAIDIISTPDFERELAAFYLTHGNDGPHSEYWQGFDPKAATANARSNFNGLHIETVGGLRAWFSANFMSNLAYEGGTRADGSRDILLNRNRLNRPLAGLVGTYVHEAAHKAGYSHRGKQSEDQKCEPPYVMGQIAEKLADPAAWAADTKKVGVCRFLKGDI